MAEVFSDSCERTSSPQNIYQGNVTTYAAGKGRTGGHALQLNSGNNAWIAVPAYTTYFVAVAFQTSSLGQIITKWWDATANAVQVYLKYDTDQVLRFYNGSNAVLAAGTHPLPLNQNFLAEAKVKIDNSTGTVELRLEGSGSAEISGSSLDTQSTANAYCNQIRFEPSVTQLLLSDIHIWDDQGIAPNGFLGNKKVVWQSLAADSATGGLNQFNTTPSQSAGSHYINMQTDDGDTSYDSDNVVGHFESCETIKLPSNITGIVTANVWARIRNDDATLHTIKLGTRNGSTNSLGADITVSSGYIYYMQATTLDPNTGLAWTLSGYNGGGSNSAAEAMVEITS